MAEVIKQYRFEGTRGLNEEQKENYPLFIQYTGTQVWEAHWEPGKQGEVSAFGTVQFFREFEGRDGSTVQVCWYAHPYRVGPERTPTTNMGVVTYSVLERSVTL